MLKQRIVDILERDRDAGHIATVEDLTERLEDAVSREYKALSDEFTHYRHTHMHESFRPNDPFIQQHGLKWKR